MSVFRYKDHKIFRVHEVAALMVSIDPLYLLVHKDSTTGCFYITALPDAPSEVVESLGKIRENFAILMDKIESLEIITRSRQAINNPGEMNGGWFEITKDKHDRFWRDRSINDERYSLKSFVFDYIRYDYDDIYLFSVCPYSHISTTATDLLRLQ